MLNLLFSQRVNIDAHGEIFDALEMRYTIYFNSLGINIFPVSCFVKDLDNYLRGIQYKGLVLSGGGDVAPKFYDQEEANPVGFSPERAKVETYLVKKMISLKLPVLGLCHGMHHLNCHFGGKLTANIHRNEAEVRQPRMNHPIKIEKNIFGLNGQYMANHYHNDGIRTTHVANCFDIFAKDLHYDVVEGIIHKDLPIMGLQWHPERDSPNDDMNMRIMKGFFKI